MTRPFAESTFAFALAFLALAAAALKSQEPVTPPPAPEPPVPKETPSEEPPPSELGKPKVERGRLGPELVIPVPSRQPSASTAARRLPDLPGGAPRQKPAADPREKAETAAAAKSERTAIAEASSSRLVESLLTRKRVDDPEGRRIRVELAARGAEARIALRTGLTSKRSDAAQAIAELLFAIAEEADLELLHRRALQGLTASAAKHFARGFLAAEPAEREWILAWFDSANPNLRAEAEHCAIELQLEPEPFRTRLAHPHPDVRRRAFHVLELAGDPQLLEHASRLLRDDYLPTAQTCAALLVARGEPAAFAELLAEVRASAYDRSWGRAIAVLLEREVAHAETHLALEDLAGFEAAFSHPDTFVSSAAATAVGALALRCDDERASLWLRERVPHLLVRALSGDVTHADLPLLRPSILRVLQRASGLDLGPDGAAWKTWWSRVGGSFVPRREFFALDPAALGELVCIYSTDDGESARERRFALVSAAALASGACAPQQRWLKEADLRALIAAIAESGLASAEWPSGRLGSAGTPRRSIELRRGEVSKRVDGGPGVENPRWEQLCATFEALEARTAWQPYLDRDRHAQWGAFHDEEVAWWSAEHTPAEQRARLRGSIAAALDDLDPALAVEAYWDLERALPDGDRLETTTCEGLVAFVGETEAIDPLRRALLELVAKRGEPAALERVKTCFARRPSRYAERLVLGGILAAAGPDAVRAALEDARPPVLAGAAEAAHVLAGDPPLLRLYALSQHVSLQVRLAAIRALGKLGADSASTALLDRFEHGESEERLEAAQALARLSAPQAMGVLSQALAGDDALLRHSIFTGLADSDGLESALVLASFALGRNALHPDGLRARSALLGKPLDQVRSVCRSLAEEVETRRAAALLWAEALDAAALPLLLSLLEEAPDDEGVIQGLAWLTCRAFSAATALADAQRFAEEHVDETAQHWFARACEEAGLGLPESVAHLRTAPSGGTLEALCRVLEVGAPELRMHAARYLHEAFREDLGYVTLSTDAATCARIAEAYRELLRGKE